MNWTDTRRKLLSLAAGRRTGGSTGTSPRGPTAAEPAARTRLARPVRATRVPTGRPAGIPAREPPVPRAASLCIASGKGGTGKSVVSASLATLLSLRGRTLVVDADLGVGNAHILQDVSPPASFVDVVEGNLSVREVLVACSESMDLLAAGSGVPRMTDLSKFELHLIAAGLEQLEREYGFLIVDSAAGVSAQTLAFARASDVVLIVTTPDLTAMTDAYALLKLLHAEGRTCRPLLLVNRAADEEEAERVVERIARVSGRFLGAAPPSVGWLPEDPAVASSVNHRGAVVLLEPGAPVTAALRRVCVRVQEELGREHPRGLGRVLREAIGYADHLS